MKKAFYEDVLEACASNQNIEMWDNRDMSFVGERWINLSGGQKQRNQLARAVMKDGLIVQSGKSEELIADSDDTSVEDIEEKHGQPNCYDRLFELSRGEETEIGCVKWNVHSIFVTAAHPPMSSSLPGTVDGKQLQD
ncbi:hypothetical protein V6N13_108115 [Hibiscus sabdariffa]